MKKAEDSTVKCDTIRTIEPRENTKMLTIFEKIRKGIVGREIEIKSILAAMEAGKHILLEGPPGTSKSTVLRRIARETNVPFYIVEGNIDLTPAKLVGHFNPAKVMEDSYQPEYFEKGPLTMAMEVGGILYIEEFNRMPADVSNVLISPMEEGEISIPRYGVVKAVRPFTVIASQNPYDDVGTVRVSRAFLDRICLIKMNYQSEDEEREIVRVRTGGSDHETIAFAVKMVRKTREHPDLKMGASVRGAIDLVDIFIGMQKIAEQSNTNFLVAAQMALSNKIWLNEMASKTPDQLIEEIWTNLGGRHKEFHGRKKKGKTDSASNQDVQETEVSEKKKSDDRRVGGQFLDDELDIEYSYFYQVASYLNAHPEELPQFFEKQDSLEVFANIFGMLKHDVRAMAVKIASRLIIKIAKQIADTGYRSGQLKLVRGFTDGAEIELDRSLEKYAEEPDRGVVDNLMSYRRHRERNAFVMMFDHSYSMKGMKIILAAITAASIAQHFKNDYAILAFSNQVSFLKGIEEPTGPEEVLEKLFALELRGDTDIRLALERGLRHIDKFERKMGLLLTDGAWNQGGNPLQVAVKFDKLSVIGFPPVKQEKIRQLALKGKGNFCFVEDEKGIAGAILNCLS
ncbi:MAG: AAA domain-containing protein [Proteobacteria bacterium]|nr:AAA domain-containing protein [Pseudomonadota bacterium]NIS68943.1 AAA domain-containing protein [Pseudomonadota bacterium]